MSDKTKHQPWSEIETSKLKGAFKRGATIKETAEFLGRDVEEVRAKLASLNAPPVEVDVARRNGPEYQ